MSADKLPSTRSLEHSSSTNGNELQFEGHNYVSYAKQYEGQLVTKWMTGEDELHYQWLQEYIMNYILTFLRMTLWKAIRITIWMTKNDNKCDNIYGWWAKIWTMS